MPTKSSKKPSTKSKKRYGHHQKRSSSFRKTYLPYLPVVVAVFVSVLLSGYRTSYGVLAYATNTSTTGLLAATNQQRTAAGVPALTLNQQLNNAAQAKANDMVARNYWSHNTPDGQEPWIFVSNAGYNYVKAGENLAYGFPNSDDTIAGWMNSQTHKDNMLDSAFSEVGFGFTNSEDFNDAGNQTVVVAMYGKPQTLAQTDSTPEQPATQPLAPSTPITQQAAPAPPTAQPNTEQFFTVPNSTNIAGLQPVTRQISRVDTLTGGTAPWAYTVIAFALGSSITVLLVKHGVGVRKLFVSGEQFVLHHPWIDSTVLAIVIIALTLTQTVGFIQ